jgi:hypothetical protein
MGIRRNERSYTRSEGVPPAPIAVAERREELGSEDKGLAWRPRAVFAEGGELHATPGARDPAEELRPSAVSRSAARLSQQRIQAGTVVSRSDGELRLDRGRVPADLVDFASEYRLLRERLSRSDEVLDALRFPAEDITAFRNSVSGDNSGSALGVARVDTVRGPKVIKLIAQEPNARNPEVGDRANRSSDQVLTQLQLGELGYGIPVSGTLDRQGVTALLERFPELRPTAAGRPPPSYGIVMDYVPDGWNPKPLQNRADLQKPAPAWAAYFDFERLEQRIARTCIAIEALGLQDHDFQLIFTRAGEALVIDPELFDVRDRASAVPGESLQLALQRLNETPLSQTFGQSARRARSYLDTLHGLVFSGGFDEAASYRTALRSLDLKNETPGAAPASPLAVPQAAEGLFGRGERLGLTRVDLQWHALNILRDSPQASTELRQIAEAKLPYFQRPKENRAFTATVREVLGTERFLRDVVDYALETFTSPQHDGRFRELLEENRRRALTPGPE